MQYKTSISGHVVILSVIIMLLTSNFGLVCTSGQNDELPVTSATYSEQSLGFPSGWSEDIQLSFTNPRDTSIYPRNYSVYPQIAVSGDHAHVVWESIEVTKVFGVPFVSTANVTYIRSPDNGQTWSNPIFLSNMTPGLWNDQHSAGHPRIAVNGSTVHVVWDEIMGADDIFRIMYRRSLDNGETWGPIVNITPYSNTIWRYNPDIAVWNDTVHIVWDERVSSDEEIFYVNSTDNGESWNSPQRITFNSASSDTAAHIAVNDTNVHIVWARFFGDTEMMYVRSLDGGISWEPESLLSLDDGWGSSASDIAVDESAIHIGVVEDKHKADGGERQAYYINSTDNGVIFNPQYGKRLPDTDIYNISGTESIAVDGDNIHVTFSDTRDDSFSSELYYKYSSDGGTTWNSDLRLTYAPNGTGRSSVAISNDFIHIVFQDSRTGENHSSEIFYKRYPDFPVDMTPPTITHTPITSASVGSPIDIIANVTDDVKVSNVTLYYQNVGDITYTPIDMIIIYGNNQSGEWSAPIPAQDKTGTVHYFIWANDISGNNITSPIMGDYSIQITGPPSIEVTNLVGGEDWTGGRIHQIEFIALDTEDAPAVLDVFLNYTSSTENGVIATIKGDENPYDWTLPNIDVNDVKINATVIDSDGNKAYDDSLEFTIDSSLPEVVSTNPVNNSTGISIFQPIVIQFNEKMNISSVIVNQTNGTNPGGWNWFWNDDKDMITGIHDAWPRGGVVEITVQTGYKDYSDPGNANNTAYVFLFTTETNPSPEIVHMNISEPQELGDEIRINATITDDGTVMNAVLWWRNVNNVWHENYMQKNGNEWFYLVLGQMKESRIMYQINATDDLQQKNTTIIYEFDIVDSTPPVIVHAPVERAVIGELINITCQVSDLGGVDVVNLYYKNEIDSNYTQVTMNPGYWFELPVYSVPVTIEYYIPALDIYGNDASTEIYNLEIIDPSVPDTTRPAVLLVTPTGDNIPILTSISIVFSEAMNRTSVEGAILVSPVLSGISYTWLNDQTLMLAFDGLQFNTTYMVTIETEAMDLEENGLAGEYSWQFSTVEEPEIVEQPTPDNWGWVGIIIFLIVIIALLLLYLFHKEEKEPDNINKEP